MIQLILSVYNSFNHPYFNNCKELSYNNPVI